MKRIERLLDNLYKDYTTVFKANIESLDKEIIRDSPVRWGGFKTGWQLVELDPDQFKYKRVNNSVYGNRLWRYHHSKQGWSPIGGDNVVMRHTNTMRRAFNMLNKRLIRLL